MARFNISYERNGPSMVAAFLTGGASLVAAELIGERYEGWYCTVEDRRSGESATGFGMTKGEAKQEAFDKLKGR